MTRRLLIIHVACLLLSSCSGFQGPSLMSRAAEVQLFAKKGKSSAGKGFGTTKPPATESRVEDAPASFGGLKSVEAGGSDAIPSFTAMDNQDPNVPVEERTKQILRDQYGLRTLEDQRREEKIVEQRLKIQRLKEAAEKDENFDIMAVLPAPLLIGIDRFLKLGLAVCTVLFVAAGVGISAEAWAAASGNPLPEEYDQFIVNVIEPNFTPGLFVLLGFSVSLGIFASAQLGSSGSVYSED